MATLSLSARFGLYTPTYGPDPAETAQTLVPADGWKKFFFHNVWFDDDAIYDDSTGTVTIPATGIYYINVQMNSYPGTSPGEEFTVRILADGTTTIAEGFQKRNTGTGQPSETATYAACIEGGTTLTFEAQISSDNVAHMVGYLSLVRVPDPFAIADLDTGPVDDFVEWSDVCNQPSWLDPGNLTRWTVSEDGFYFLTLKDNTTVPIGFFDEYWRTHYVYVNGVDIDNVSANAGASSNVPFTTILELTAGDYVEVFVLFKTGAPIGLSVADMTMYKIPDAVAGAEIYEYNFVYTTVAFTEPTYGTSVFDTDGYWAGAGDKSKLVVPSGKGGKYLVWAQYVEAANREINYLISSSTDQYQYGCACSENYALQNVVSPTSFALWDLADGDYIQMFVQNGDAASGGGPGNAYHLRFGLVNIDGWTYTSQNGCPCPSGFLPQIYRWLGR